MITTINEFKLLLENNTDEILSPITFLKKDSRIIDYDGIFSTNKSQGSEANDLLESDTHNKGYLFFYKRKQAELVMMNPKEYLSIVRKEFKIESDNLYDGSKTSLLKAIENGNKIDMPYLSYLDGRFNQEGRNRSALALELGEKLIPVLIMKDVTDKDLKNKTEEILSYYKDSTDISKDMFNDGFHRDAVRYVTNY